MSINQTNCNITDTKVNDKVLEGRFDKLFFYLNTSEILHEK